MKIVHVITGLEADGAENFLARLCRGLDDLTHHVISLTTLGPAARDLRHAGIPVEALGLKRALQGPAKFSALVYRLRELRPDIVHTWMYHADLIGGLAARMARVPKVAWSIRHGNLDPRDIKPATRAIARLCAALSPYIPDAIVTNSLNARTVHAEFGYRSPVFPVIPNGFDLERFYPDPSARVAIRAQLGMADDDFLIGMMGRFQMQKGHRVLLQAAERLHIPYRKLRVVMAGRGVDDDNAEIREWLDATGLRSSTLLLGERRDMPALLASLDLLVLPSISGEAFPNIVGEAMACEVPCVVTDVGDCAFIVGDTAAVVTPNDVRALAAGISRLIEMAGSERRALGARARQRVVESFDLASVVRRYRNLYEGLASHVS
jgi:glycosyltransferase involved in cell wall biosynthesis